MFQAIITCVIAEILLTSFFSQNWTLPKWHLYPTSPHLQPQSQPVTLKKKTGVFRVHTALPHLQVCWSAVPGRSRSSTGSRSSAGRRSRPASSASWCGRWRPRPPPAKPGRPRPGSWAKAPWRAPDEPRLGSRLPPSPQLVASRTTNGFITGWPSALPP